MVRKDYREHIPRSALRHPPDPGLKPPSLRPSMEGMDRNGTSAPHPPLTSATGAGSGSAPPDGARVDLEIAIYPGRLGRSGQTVELSPSQAVRYAEDPVRRAAAEETGRERHTARLGEPLSLAALWSETVLTEPVALAQPTTGAAAEPVVPDEPTGPAEPLAAAPPAGAGPSATPAPAPTEDWRSGTVSYELDDLLPAGEPAAPTPTPAPGPDTLHGVTLPQLPAAQPREAWASHLPSPEATAASSSVAGPDLTASDAPVPTAAAGQADAEPWWAAAKPRKLPWWRRLFGRGR
jgi:hypothetical protein